MGRQNGVNVVRVGIIDDSADIRRLLRSLFEEDDRFQVIGEGVDGIEAIELSGRLQPDLLLLDRQMPRLGGVEAIPEIRRVSPRTSIVLFTAKADSLVRHAAVSAGALGVIEKSAVDVVERLAQTLLDHWSNPDAEIELQIGPVPAAAAAEWIGSTRRIVTALRGNPTVLTEPPPSEILDLFERFLAIWEGVNRATDVFSWTARAKSSDVRRLVEWWALVDGMSDDQIQRLGVEWSSPEGRLFYHALTAAVLQALEDQAASQELASALRRRWSTEA